MHVSSAAPASSSPVDSLYARVKRIARSQLGGFPNAPTLSATALVHEAWLRVAVVPVSEVEHLVSLWTRTMRQVLIDYCRARTTHKRNGHAVDLDEVQVETVDDAAALLDFEQQLRAMEQHDPRLARVVELRVYAGLDAAGTAAELGVDVRTIQRDWLRARAWLARSS